MTQKEIDAAREEQYYKQKSKTNQFKNRLKVPTPKLPPISSKTSKPVLSNKPKASSQNSSEPLSKLPMKTNKPIGTSKTIVTKQDQRPKVIPPPIKQQNLQKMCNSVVQHKAQPQPRPPPYKPSSTLPPIGATYKRGIYDDYDQNSDEYDYDEESDGMSDFIDDGQDDAEPHYSEAIRQIFGYDKRKYRGVIEDDIEEANYATVMKEECRTLKLGIQEDLEDIAREEEEKRQKLKKMKRR